MRTLAGLTLLTAFLWQCGTPPDGRFQCAEDMDCPADFVCRVGVADRTQPLCYAVDVDPSDGGPGE